jgi:lantibiotic transport system permease protein
MMPLYITLQTALIAGLDHSENQWKAILARPIPRWTVYVAKVVIVAALTVAASIVLLAGILIAGTVLRAITSEVRFGFPIPFTSILQQTAMMTGLAFLSLTIQQWVSLRWRSFSVATGFGIVATVTTFAMLLAAGQYGSWPEYYPWALPMLVVGRQPHNTAAVLCISAIIGIVVTVVGCMDFCRREVT